MTRKLRTQPKIEEKNKRIYNTLVEWVYYRKMKKTLKIKMIFTQLSHIHNFKSIFKRVTVMWITVYTLYTSCWKLKSPFSNVSCVLERSKRKEKKTEFCHDFIQSSIPKPISNDLYIKYIQISDPNHIVETISNAIK